MNLPATRERITAAITNRSDLVIRPDTVFYCGTFNPIHIGHLMIAQAVLNQFESTFGVQSVTFIPSGHPPHRHTDPDLLDARRRLAMVRLATRDHPAFHVSDMELRRTATDGRASYTVDTLRSLIQDYGVRPPVPIIIGSDALAALASWHEPSVLIDLACFLQAPRPGFPPVESITLNQREHPLRTRLIDMPPLALSSSRIRQMLRETADMPEALRYVLPESVRHYLQDNRCYR